MSDRATRQLGLRRRLALALVLGGLLLTGCALAGWVAVDRLGSAVTNVTDRAAPARLLATQMLANLVDQETGVRGYGLSGREPYLLPYVEGRTESVRAEQRLRVLLGGDQVLLADLDRIDAARTAWQDGFAEPVVAVVRSGGPNAVSPADYERGRAAFEQVRAAYDGLDRHLAQRRETARAELDTSMWLLALWVVAAGALVTALALWLVLALRRWVSRPIESLAAEVRQVAGGDLEHRVSLVGPPELTGLAGDVDSMRQRILAEVRAAVDAREQLAEQAGELRRSNAELEQFAYVASHDLQEPLRKVASFCQMLQRRYAGQLDERADQYIEFAVEGAKRMQRLINDLLAFSRVGRGNDRFEEVDCQQALDQAVRTLEDVVTETDGSVVAERLPVVRGDATLLVQLFQNLVGNSLKFHGSQPPRVRLEAVRDGDYWRFRCADNGIGIDPQYADRIFVIFQRLHGRGTYEGTGIGLALCRKIVEYHGGRMWLEPSPGTGTVMCWTLPVLDENEPTNGRDGDHA